jgi:hypothetical protein
VADTDISSKGSRPRSASAGTRPATPPRDARSGRRRPAAAGPVPERGAATPKAPAPAAKRAHRRRRRYARRITAGVLACAAVFALTLATSQQCAGSAAPSAVQGVRAEPGRADSTAPVQDRPSTAGDSHASTQSIPTACAHRARALFGGAGRDEKVVNSPGGPFAGYVPLRRVEIPRGSSRLVEEPLRLP